MSQTGHERLKTSTPVIKHQHLHKWAATHFPLRQKTHKHSTHPRQKHSLKHCGIFPSAHEGLDRLFSGAFWNTVAYNLLTGYWLATSPTPSHPCRDQLSFQLSIAWRHSPPQSMLSLYCLHTHPHTPLTRCHFRQSQVTFAQKSLLGFPSSFACPYLKLPCMF